MKTTIFRSVCLSALYLICVFGVSFAQTGRADKSLPEAPGLSSDVMADIYLEPALGLVVHNENLNELKNVEIYPAAENGLDLSTSLQNLIEYPQSAIEKGVEGVVKVMCTVETDGHITNVMILEDVGSECTEQVCKAVRKLKLKPAMQNGFARKITIVIPVRFQLI